jgi:hypothetical protein
MVRRTWEIAQMTFQINDTVEISGKGLATVTAVIMRRGKPAAYDVKMEKTGATARYAAMMVSAPTEFAAPDPNAFKKPIRDFYGDQARMFARSGIGG